MFPATVANFSQAEFLSGMANYFRPDSVLYNLCFVGLIVFFCFFYTAIVFDPKDIAENLKKQGAFVPGIRHKLGHNNLANSLEKISIKEKPKYTFKIGKQPCVNYCHCRRYIRRSPSQRRQIGRASCRERV